MKAQMRCCLLGLSAAVVCFAGAWWIDWTYPYEPFRVGDVMREGKMVYVWYDEANQRFDTQQRMERMKPFLLALSCCFLAIAGFSWYSRCRKEPTSIKAAGVQDAKIHEQ